MKCPWCGKWTFVLDSRYGTRRRECGNGHRFNTVEVTDMHHEYLMVQRRMREARAVLKKKGILK